MPRNTSSLKPSFRIPLSSHSSTTTSAAKSGAKILVSSAPIGSISTKMASAVRSNRPANSSIPKKESARSAMKATLSSMENALNKTKALLITLDAQYGITESAPNALKDGISTPIMFALQLVISALNGMPQLVPALHATMVHSLAKDNVLSIPIPALSLTATLFAKLGLQANVPNALTELSSTPKDSAPQ